jgi:hypothetical protein
MKTKNPKLSSKMVLKAKLRDLVRSDSFLAAVGKSKSEKSPPDEKRK